MWFGASTVIVLLISSYRLFLSCILSGTMANTNLYQVPVVSEQQPLDLSRMSLHGGTTMKTKEGEQKGRIQVKIQAPGVRKPVDLRLPRPDGAKTMERKEEQKERIYAPGENVQKPLDLRLPSRGGANTVKLKEEEQKERIQALGASVQKPVGPRLPSHDGGTTMKTKEGEQKGRIQVKIQAPGVRKPVDLRLPRPDGAKTMERKEEQKERIYALGVSVQKPVGPRLPSHDDGTPRMKSKEEEHMERTHVPTSSEQPFQLILQNLDEIVLVKLTNRRELRGRLHAFDKHLNLVLGDVEETVTTVEFVEETCEEFYRENKRHLPMLFVRGGEVVLVTSAHTEFGF